MLHSKAADMLTAAVEEYLEIAKRSAWDKELNCFGYPATLLILCVIEQIGQLHASEVVQIPNEKGKIETREVTRKNPWPILNHSLFNMNLSLKHIQLVKELVRNPLAHQVFLERGAVLIPDSAEPPEIKVIDKRLYIDVRGLQKKTSRAWDIIKEDRVLIDNWSQNQWQLENRNF